MALTYLGMSSSTSTSASYSFSSMSLGTASSDRYIIVTAVGRKGGTGMAISSITVAGITATQLVQGTYEGDSNSQPVGIFIAAVPTGTSGTVVLNFSGGSALRASVAVYALTGMSNPVAYDTDTAGVNAQQVDSSVDAPDSSYVLSVAMHGANASNPRWNVGSTVQDYGSQFQTNGYHGGASLAITTATSAVQSIFRTDNSQVKNIATVSIATGSSTLTKTQTSVARIANVRTATRTSVARIAKGVTKTQTATASIAVPFAADYYNPGVSYGTVLTKTQSAIARIATNRTLTQSSTARIANSPTKTQTSIARVATNSTKTQTATASVMAPVTTTQTATAYIITAGTKIQTAKAAIIVVGVTKTQLASARIAQGFTKTQTSVARISHTYEETQTSTARIQTSQTASQTATARIIAPSSRIQTAIARIAHTKTTTQTATANIVEDRTKTQTATAYLVVQREITQTATATIIVDVTATQTATAYIGAPYVQPPDSGGDEKYDQEGIPEGEIVVAPPLPGDNNYQIAPLDNGDYDVAAIDESNIYGVE